MDPQALSLIPLELGYWRRLSPSKQVGLTTQMEVFLKRYAPLYASNESLKRIVTSPVSAYQQSQSFTLQPDGFMPWQKANPEYVEAQRVMHSSFAKEHNFEISEHNRVALESIKENAEKHNFNVFIVNSPVYEGLYEDPDFQHYYAQMRANLNAFADQSSKVYFLDDTITFPKEKMENADHVIYSSAKTYTRQIAHILNTRFAQIAQLIQQ
jgi:hypothetical protein